MIANAMTTDENILNTAKVSAHRCIGCLRGADGGKRDCAIRHLLADGFTPEAITSAELFFKTAH
ncbi:hypothetical protein [Paenirhodobacter sp.]|uniref:hypothetical protein n=1 Tax=Paenirhodobacter sp. TaxID=1965326 RepID=UPI003B3C38DF